MLHFDYFCSVSAIEEMFNMFTAPIQYVNQGLSAEADAYGRLSFFRRGRGLGRLKLNF
jgi:hypothetical protein